MKPICGPVAVLCMGVVACGGNDADPAARIVVQDHPAGLTAVWGRSSQDVWVVGGDTGDGSGPAMWHKVGPAWTRVETGQQGDLWWVFGLPEGPVFSVGQGGMVLRVDGTTVSKMTTPGTGTVTGVWGSSATDLWAVGGDATKLGTGFVWHFDGAVWKDVPLANRPIAVWKVFGRGAGDVWMVGTEGAVLHVDAQGVPQPIAPLTNQDLFTIHGFGDTLYAVGGTHEAVILQAHAGTWIAKGTDDATPLIGVHAGKANVWAVGLRGSLYKRQEAGWQAVPTGLSIPWPLHAVWQDETDAVWAVGGNVQSQPLRNGLLMYKGPGDPGHWRAP